MDLNTILAIVALISAIGSAGVCWGVLSERMKHMRERQKETDAKVEEHSKELIASGIRFARVEGKLDSIGEDIAEVKKLLQERQSPRPH